MTGGRLLMLMHAVTLLGCDVLHGTTIKQDPMGLNAGACLQVQRYGACF